MLQSQMFMQHCIVSSCSVRKNVMSFCFLSFFAILACTVKQWYFVTIIVLTYCEKKLFQCEEKSEKKVCKFEAVRPRICNVFEIFVPHTIEQFLFTVSRKYYGNRLLFRLFLFFPKNKKIIKNFWDMEIIGNIRKK